MKKRVQRSNPASGVARHPCPEPIIDRQRSEAGWASRSGLLVAVTLYGLGLPASIPRAWSAPSPQTDAVQPVLPPGISDFDIEFYTSLAYTWRGEDGVQVIECLGDFNARMGHHVLAAQDAVIWFKRTTWEDRPYYDMEIFLWKTAEVHQPAGTLETGPALVVTLRTFGRLLLNADAQADKSDADSELYGEGLRARGLLDAAPTAEPEAAEQPVQVAPTLEQIRLSRPRPLKKIDFSANSLIHQKIGDLSVFIVKGDVQLSQGSPATPGEYLELRADSAVLYVNADKLGSGVDDLLAGEESDKRTAPSQPADVPPAEEPTLTGGEKTPRRTAREWISAAYLEGDVVLMRGQRMIRASKIFYDFKNDQALILDVVARALEPKLGLPIYIRAEEIRQLSASEYMAKNAQITTSEFHTPHVSIGASQVHFKDRTPRNARGDVVGIQAGTYKAYHTTLNLEGVPVSYWPVSSGDFSRDRMAFRSAKFGYAGDFGVTAETRWYFFNLLGLEQPEGFDATYKLDYFTDRGPATGLDIDYERDNYFGLLRSYYLHDDGDDDISGRPNTFRINSSGAPDRGDRGRFLWRHRQYLPKDWELSFEVSYISDDQYLENFERNEFENAKEQETLVRLLKREDNRQFSLLANWRINEFDTQTEHLPDARFSIVGEPLADRGAWYHDSRLGVVRFRPDDRRFFNGKFRIDNTGETGSVGRGDLREEVEFPLRLGPVNLTPYIAVRGTTWDDSIEGVGNRHSRGGQNRAYGAYGLRSSMVFSKVDDTVESELFDLHRLRHIIKADVVAWNAHANTPPTSLTPFDSGVEDIDDFGGAVLGIRQRVQTQRGGPGHWRTVDWITWDVEAGVFEDRLTSDRTRGDFILARPEDSISSNFIRSNFQLRLSDSTVLVHDGVYDIDRGNVGTSNLSLAVEREPRLAYFVGWRYIHDTDNNLFAFGTNYKLSEKHTVSFRETFDIEAGRSLQTELAYIRRWPRWYSAIAFDIDRTFDNIGITLSFWPEGASRLALGSKRFTGLAESVGIRPR